MVKKLDFNALEQPVLEITLRDKEQTVVRITTPTEDLVERLKAMAADIRAVAEDNTGELVRKAFGLIAELMNLNLDGLTFTAESLRDKYRMKLYDATVFIKVYLEFLQEIETAKN